MNRTRLNGCVVYGLLLWLCWANHGKAQRLGAQNESQTRGRTVHFAPTSTAWNGCSRWMYLASQQGLQVETPRVWDWTQARIQDPILILAPQREDLDSKPLRAFVEAGGRVLLTDDFGAGDRLWESFGLQGKRYPVAPRSPAQPVMDIHITVPHPFMDADFLLRQAGFSFLNLPQWFFLDTNPKHEPLLYARVYRSNLPDRQMEGYVLVRIRQGRGVLLVMSDPSAFINQMIRYGDNQRLAVNLLRYLALPVQAKRLIVLWGNFRWHSHFKQSPPWLAQTSVQIWDKLIDLHQTLTSTPALLEAYPPHWQEPSHPVSVRYQQNKASSDRFALFHLYQFTHLWWILGLFLLGWLILGMRWMPWFSDARYLFHREPVDLFIPHRLTEQIQAHRTSTHDFLWPLILLKEEFASFLHLHLPPLQIHTQRQRKLFTTLSLPVELPTELRATDLARYPLGLRVWHQLIQHHEEHQTPTLTEEQWKQLYYLLTQVPDRRDWEQAMQHATKVDAKQLKTHYQISMYCLRQLGLYEAFRTPLREQANPSSS